jgi:anti-sigma factor RsiW
MNHTSLPCSNALDRLPLFAGGDLEPEAREQVRVHLESCASCRAEAGRALAARSEFVRGLEQLVYDGARSAPHAASRGEPTLWTRVRAELASDGRLCAPAGRSIRAGPRVRLARLAAPALVLAAAAAVLVFLDPFKGASSAGDAVPDAPHVAAGGATPLEPVPEPVPRIGSGLQRLTAEDEHLIDQAVPFHRVHIFRPGGVPAGAADDASLAGYR